MIRLRIKKGITAKIIMAQKSPKNIPTSWAVDNEIIEMHEDGKEQKFFPSYWEYFDENSHKIFEELKEKGYVLDDTGYYHSKDAPPIFNVRLILYELGIFSEWMASPTDDWGKYTKIFWAIDKNLYEDFKINPKKYIKGVIDKRKEDKCPYVCAFGSKGQITTHYRFKRESIENIYLLDTCESMGLRVESPKFTDCIDFGRISRLRSCWAIPKDKRQDIEIINGDLYLVKSYSYFAYAEDSTNLKTFKTKEEFLNYVLNVMHTNGEEFNSLKKGDNVIYTSSPGQVIGRNGSRIKAISAFMGRRINVKQC